MATIPVSAVSRGLLMATLVTVVGFYPARASAQDGQLRAATIAASAAAAADWATTYHALKFYQVREMNPLLRPMDHAPGSMVSVGALMDAGAVTAWNMTVAKRNRKLAVVGLWAMTGFRAYLAIHNIRNEQIAARR